MILEELITRDQTFLFTAVAYVMILVILINLDFFLSPAIGTTASIIYFLINGTFLGYAFFEKEDLFLRFMLGTLLLVVFLGFISFAIMITYNLDVISSAVVLCIVTAFSSLSNKRMKKKNVNS